MAAVTKRLGKGNLTASVQTAYTVPTGTTTLIKAVTVCNTSASPATFGVALAGTTIIADHTIKAKDTITLPFLDQVLQSGESITVLMPTGSGVTYYISGKEVT